MQFMPYKYTKIRDKFCVNQFGIGFTQYSSESIQEILDKMVLIETHPKTQKYFGSSKWQKRIISKTKMNLLKSGEPNLILSVRN